MANQPVKYSGGSKGYPGVAGNKKGGAVSDPRRPPNMYTPYQPKLGGPGTTPAPVPAPASGPGGGGGANPLYRPPTSTLNTPGANPGLYLGNRQVPPGNPYTTSHIYPGGGTGGVLPTQQPAGGGGQVGGGFSMPPNWGPPAGHNVDMSWYDQLAQNYGLSKKWTQQADGSWTWEYDFPTQNDNGTWNDTMNNWGEPVGTPGPYLQNGGKTHFNYANAYQGPPLSQDQINQIWQQQVQHRQQGSPIKYNFGSKPYDRAKMGRKPTSTGAGAGAKAGPSAVNNLVQWRP